MRFSGVACAVAILTATLTARADDPVQSRWRPDDLRIDGVITDWPGQTFLSKEVASSVVNDAQDLYILVATSDPAVTLQLTRAGLIVYLDPKGGRGKSFGIRIPPLGNRLAPGNLPAGGEDEPPALTYFDVVGPGADEMRTVELADNSGIDLRIGAHEGTFFLELKVPFATGPSRPYAPGITLAKGEVGLTIVTPDPPRTPRIGRGGRGGVFSGGGAGAGMGMPSPPKGKEVDIWTKVLLAKRPMSDSSTPH